MTITTSKAKTYTVTWIDTPIQDASKLLLAMEDSRDISQIAPEFEGLTSVQRFDEYQGDKTYDGYTALLGITRYNGVVVQITLAKPEG